MPIRTSLIVLALAAGAVAQPPGRGPGRGYFGGGPPPDARLIGAVAGMQRQVVKGAPYSADMVTEISQALPDGNRIHQTSTAKIYRDAEGRVRNEQSLAGLGALAPTSGSQQVVFINDPVSGVNYALNVNDKTATRSVRRGGGPPPEAGRQMAGRRLDAPNGPPPGRGFGRGQAGRAGQNVKTESLGRQTIEGFRADGTRTTITIPAGQMGNEQPIQIVSETWYSPDLQTTIYSKHTDPRAGETVFRLTNISRDAPPASLFQPPADYQISEATGGGSGGRGQRMPPRQ